MPYTLSIPSTSLSQPSASAKPYTVYNLTITNPLRSTVLQKRYSDFTELHSELSSAVSASPPAPLPGKSWWFTRTVSSPRLTEERRDGLEQYVVAIETCRDPRWRESTVWRSFLGFPQGPSRRDSMTGDAEAARNQNNGLTPAMWLDLHANLKTQLQEARTQLARREAPESNVAMQHEASAGAKRSLVKSNTLILRLEEGLKGLNIGEGEARRRRDLIQRARKEREGLEGLLNAWAVTRSHMTAREGDATQGSGVGDAKRGELFNGSLATSPGKNNGSSMSGSFPTRAGRVLGGPAKETDRTRDKDNQEVLQLQKQVMQEQDMDVEEIGKVVRRLKELGVSINEEIVEQNQLLEMLDTDVDRHVNCITIFDCRTNIYLGLVEKSVLQRNGFRNSNDLSLSCSIIILRHICYKLCSFAAPHRYHIRNGI
jgi:regulator of vacuolar morphogenesis